MKMKLYCNLTSPYARKVRVAIQELGLAERIEEAVIDPLNPPPEFLAANPLSRVPTLMTERGTALPDSRIILDYLMQRKAGLIARWRGTRHWEDLRRTQMADGILDAAVASVMEKRRPESIHYTPFLDRQSAVIHRALDALQAETGHLAQTTPGRCEISSGVALAYLDFRLPYLEWRKNRDALADWFAAFAQRPSMQKTQPPAG
ncbi:MAG: glutathione S-transferase family protein [Nevskiales bacterium]|nr:glutathione S-transferase family protein [Nevskiales bacterium]